MCAQSLSHTQLFVTSWTAASSVPGTFQARILECAAFPSPGDLPDPGIKPKSPALAGGFFTTKSPGKPLSVETKEVSKLK